MSDQAMQARLQIGDWTVDRAADELRRGAELVRVEPKAMEVLLALAARAGEVVGREALLESVWHGVVVGDEALTQSVIKLRKALGDSTRAPTYIETIPKRGYRLVAPVTQSELAPQPAQAGPAPAPRARGAQIGGRAPSWRMTAFAAAAASAVLVVLLVAGTHAIRMRAQPAQSEASEAGAFDPAAESKVGVATVTVLPFVTIGPGAEQDYLARGIRSDLMTDLSRLPGLRVIDLAGNSPESHLAQAVRYVVSGSVQREAAMLRIDVRLVDAHSHEELWSQQVERPYGDLLAIQSEISRGLAVRLPGTIGAAQREQLARRYTSNPAAYDDFLHAKALFLVRRAAENERARTYYAKALEEDPQFARAYAGLAMTYAMEGRYRGADDAAALERAGRLAESALQIDPGLPEAYWALGFVHVQNRHYGQAIVALQQAIRLNPSYADAYALLGGIYTYTGQAARSIPLLRSALRLNPDGGYLYFLLLGRAYFFENDFEQALINLREAVERNPEDVESHVYLAATLVAAGDPAAARFEADEIRSDAPGFAMSTWLESYPLDRGPYRHRLLQMTSGVLSQGGDLH